MCEKNSKSIQKKMLTKNNASLYTLQPHSLLFTEPQTDFLLIWSQSFTNCTEKNPLLFSEEMLSPHRIPYEALERHKRFRF